MMTTITGKLWNADGRPANGTAVISWVAFQTHAVTIVGGQKLVEIIEGDFACDLYPNVSAFPKGMYYTVRMELDTGAVYEEYWIVPDAPAASIEQVRSSFPLEPGMLINTSQLASSGADPGMVLSWNGTAWVPGFVAVSNISPNWIRMDVDGTGADVSVTGSPVELGKAMTLHIPSASATARGVVTTGAQTFAGDKTFSGALAGPTITDLYDKVGNATQTPWKQNIDAARFDLNNVGVVRFKDYVGTSPLMVGIGNENGTLHFLTDNGGSIDIESIGNGRLMMSTDGTRRLVVHRDGNVGIGPSMNPSYKLDVQGDCNISGVYRVNGTPISTGGGAVASVFGRTGAVVAQAGDYTAAQVTNAVSTAGSYADPAWITSFAWSKLSGAPSTFPPSAHTHAAPEVTSGVFDPARLGTGTASSSTYLRGDGQWAAVSGGGGSQTPWLQHIDGGGFELRNAGHIGIGVTGIPINNAVAGRAYLTFKGSSDAGVLELATGAADADGSQLGQVCFTDPANTQTDKRVALILAARSGSTAGNRGSTLAFLTRADNASIWAERMRIDGTGRVGIGTAVPLALLHLSKSAGGQIGPELLLDNTASADADKSALTFSSGGSLRAQIRSTVDNTGGYAGTIEFWTGLTTLTERMRITGAGNVGIRTATPSCALDAAGTIRSTSQVAPTAGAGVELTYNAGSGYLLAFDRSAGVYKTLIMSGDAVAVSSQTYLQFMAAGAERMQIDSAGRVGIGGAPMVGYAGLLCQIRGDSQCRTNAGYSQLQIAGGTNTAKRLVLGFDTTQNAGLILAYEMGVAIRWLHLNPGGYVSIGSDTAVLSMADMPNSSTAIQIDTVNNKLVFYVKYSNGTLKTAQLALA